MSTIVNAVYEGEGLVRLEHQLEGVMPQDRLTLFVVPAPARKMLPVEKSGLDGLRRQIQDFESYYSLKTQEFYARFLRGEMGDNRDFIVWAGLHELLQRMTAHTQSA
ncbi:MAG: hypothetical protein KJ638_04770 [Chloroflexi bacterium]|nr:hypothetical protein [Chloroflexota bacterium]